MLLVVIVGALILFGAFGIVILATINSGAKKSALNAEQILDSAFDGRDTVSFTINMQSVKYDTVVIGAKHRGYRLAHQAENQYGPHTLIFERESSA